MQLWNKAIGSAKDQIGIKAVKDGVLVLFSNQYCMLFETSAVNMELKSEAEQDALIDIYRSFLNSLSFPLQIIIRTREIDLDNYLAELDQKLLSENNHIYRQQLHSYIRFLKSLVNVNRILSRKFYVVLSVQSSRKVDFDVVHEQLLLRSDILVKGLQRMSMHAKSLSSIDILNLFYSFYNPSAAKHQPLSDAAIRLMHTVVIKEAQ